jgi:hypothetical protein
MICHYSTTIFDTSQILRTGSDNKNSQSSKKEGSKCPSAPGETGFSSLHPKTKQLGFHGNCGIFMQFTEVLIIIIIYIYIYYYYYDYYYYIYMYLNGIYYDLMGYNWTASQWIALIRDLQETNVVSFHSIPDGILGGKTTSGVCYQWKIAYIMEVLMGISVINGGFNGKFNNKKCMFHCRL